MTRHAVHNGYADNTLVWDLTTPPSPVTGTGTAAYDVTVSGITGGPTSTYSSIRCGCSTRGSRPTSPGARTGGVRTTTGILFSTDTVRRNAGKVRVTLLLKAADGSRPAGTVGLWSNGRKIGSYTIRADDLGTKVVTLGPFRKAGVRKVYAAFQGDTVVPPLAVAHEDVHGALTPRVEPDTLFEQMFETDALLL